MSPAAHPPRPSLSVVRGPPVFRLRLRRGADLASVVRFLAHRVAFYRSSRRCDKPPALRAAPRNGGRLGGFLGVCVLRWGAREICDEFHDGARCEPRRPNPRQEAHQTWGGSNERSEARGACPRNLQNRHDEQNSNRPPDAKSAPLPNEVRHRGAADERD